MTAHRGAHPGAGGGDAADPRDDPAPGDLSPQGHRPGLPAVVTPEGPVRHPEEAHQAPDPAVGARCPDPGDMAEIAAGSPLIGGVVKNVNTLGK